MSNYVPEKVFLQGVLLHYFNMKKTAAESYRILVEVYGEHNLAKQTCKKWFARFKSGDFGLEHEERPGQPKKFEDEELGALLDFKISKRLKAAGYIQKQGDWVPHELKPRDVERRFCMSEMLLERHKKKSFLHRIFTGKMDPLRQPQAQKMICETRPISQINGKAEYPWHAGYARYLVGSERCAVLCTAKTG